MARRDLEPSSAASPAHVGVHDADAEVRWGDETLGIVCHTMAKRLFTTASIDVYLGDQLLLATGGQPYATGTVRARFEHRGASHELSLEWKRAQAEGFPVVVHVDGVHVGDALVPVRGRWKIVWLPLALFFLGVVWAAIQSALR